MALSAQAIKRRGALLKLYKQLYPDEGEEGFIEATILMEESVSETLYVQNYENVSAEYHAWQVDSNLWDTWIDGADFPWMSELPTEKHAEPLSESYRQYCAGHTCRQRPWGDESTTSEELSSHDDGVYITPVSVRQYLHDTLLPGRQLYGPEPFTLLWPSRLASAFVEYCDDLALGARLLGPELQIWGVEDIHDPSSVKQTIVVGLKQGCNERNIGVQARFISAYNDVLFWWKHICCGHNLPLSDSIHLLLDYRIKHPANHYYDWVEGSGVWSFAPGAHSQQNVLCQGGETTSEEQAKAASDASHDRQSTEEAGTSSSATELGTKMESLNI
ncbi:hypothetical protein HD806DRAFT_525418 [Xylariaceae sp. AK1471]|nr:hypothetical protein HD806DRAFT_525418 [Xylariaceae sp. AK1471]